MILYRPVDGDVHSGPVRWRPCTCFVMARLGDPIPRVVEEARDRVDHLLSEHDFASIDADSRTTGRDFLLKIWLLAVSVPVGIAIVHEGISCATMANIFYEFGWMHMRGQETLIVRIGDVGLPSDLVRTEYVQYDGRFERRFTRFLESLNERADYYVLLAEQVERNPLLAIDYLRRAYLLTGDDALRERAREIHTDAGLIDRAKNSVEMLLASF